VVGVAVAGRAAARQTDTGVGPSACSGTVAVAGAVVGAVAGVAASARTPAVPGQPKRPICGEVRGC